MSPILQSQHIKLAGRWNDPDFHLSTYRMGEGIPVVFCHGFPDIALGWQHQLRALSRAGYQAIAPNMRGYADSSNPDDVAAYTLTELTGDLVALLDALEIEKAVFVGHDWGGFVTWAMPVLHPDRVLGVAAACTPYIPFPGVDVHLAAVDGDVARQYVAWFQEYGVAEAYMDQHVATIMTKIMRTYAPMDDVIAAALADGKLNMNPFLDIESKPDLGDPLLDSATLQHYIEAFEQSGFRGGINWYRNIDHNAKEHPNVGVQPLDIPCLMLMAAEDPALRPEFAADMPERCSNLEVHLVEQAAHWVHQERAEEVNTLLLNWLRTHFPSKP